MTVPQDDDDACSDASSSLTMMSRSPTPPSDLDSPRTRHISNIKSLRHEYLPTPPLSQSADFSSQLSSVGSCTPRSDLDSSIHTYADGDACPPPKRRKLNKDSPQLARGTRDLDLLGLGERRADGKLTEDEEFAYKSLFRCLRNKRKIVVIAGAGISVSAGIPDFRSSTGLFKTLKATHNLKGSGKQLFDASVYRDAQSTSSFHTMVRSMSEMSKEAQPTEFHHLIARLAKEDRLLRLYSQNVDGLETSIEPLKTQVPLPRKAPWPRTVQLHGGLEKMVCTKCHKVSDFQPELFDSPVPPTCADCEEQDNIRTICNKRSHGVGRLRPRMVLYNEHNPDDEAIGACTKSDLRTRPDAVLVVGTSCKVPGVRRIVGEMCRLVRDKRDGLAIWINRDPVPSGKDLEGCWDIIVKGDADEIAQQAALGRWNDEPIPVECVSDSEVKAARGPGSPKIMLPSPTKSVRSHDALRDPQPISSSRQSFSTVESAKQAPKLDTYFARSGKGTLAEPTATKPRGRGRPAKSKASKPKSKVSLPQKSGGIKAHLATTKPTVAPSSNKSRQKRGLKAEIQDLSGPMEGVPQGDPRRNSTPSSPVDLKKPVGKLTLKLKTSPRV